MSYRQPQAGPGKSFTRIDLPLRLHFRRLLWRDGCRRPASSSSRNKGGQCILVVKPKVHALEVWEDLMNSGQLAVVLVPGAKGVDGRQHCGSGV